MRRLRRHLPGIIAQYQVTNVLIHHIYSVVPPIGIQNPDNACYMNALLQSLFHTYKFRNALGHVMEFSGKPVTTALYRVFQSLQAGEEPGKCVFWRGFIRHLL